MNFKATLLTLAKLTFLLACTSGASTIPQVAEKYIDTTQQKTVEVFTIDTAALLMITPPGITITITTST